MDTPAFVHDVFASIDRLDPDGFVGWLEADARFVYGNGEPVHGREAIRGAVVAFVAQAGERAHENIEHWREGETVLCRVDVTDCRGDGRSVRLPAMTLWRLRDGRIADDQRFNDLTPLFA